MTNLTELQELIEIKKNRAREQDQVQSKVQAVLKSTNWTGLTLIELTSAGRISGHNTNIQEVIQNWVNEALGDTDSLTEFDIRRRVIAEVIAILKTLSH